MFPLPTVSVNVGFNHAFTDVRLSDGPSPVRQLGYQLTITQRVTKFLNAGFELYTGSVYGEEQRGLFNLNYRTSLVSPRLSLEYNFYPLLKPDSKGRQLIRPYIGFGLGMVLFRSKGDLKDANGNPYQYWSNGGVYAEEEGSVDISEATLLERDFEYETDLRDANLDGFRKYSQMAFSLPVNAGIRFQISKNIGVNAAFAYVLNVTDLIDNVNSESVGARQGTAGFDNHLFGSVGLSVFLGRTKPSSEPKKPRFNEEIAANDKAEASENEISASDQILNEEGTAEIAPYSPNQTIKDPLATMSKTLVDASESFEQLAKQSDELVSKANAQLQEIGDRKFDSNKDLKTAKQESIQILESSIAKLVETNSELNETASRLNMVYTDISSENITTTATGTEKIETTVKSAIPAVESLKEKVKAAKSPEELKSLMNIASRNLSHTNDIFSEESQRMNSSISEARKTVVQKRTELLLMNTKDIETLVAANPEEAKLQLVQIEEELENLQAEGTISEEEFSELKRDLEESLATIESMASADSPSGQQESNISLRTNQTELANAANQLASVSKIINASNQAAQKALSETSEQLGLIAGKNLKSREELNAAKEEALKLLETSLSALNQSNDKISEATEGLSKASVNLSDNKVENKLVTTETISSSVSNTSNLVESSKAQIRSSKSAEELKSILSLAASSIDRTLDIFDSESSKINTSILQARKAVVEAKALEIATAETTQKVDYLNSDIVIPENQEIFKEELAELQKEGLITNEEFSELSGSLDKNEEQIAARKVAQLIISRDSEIKTIPLQIERISQKVQELSALQIQGLSDQTRTLEKIQTELPTANNKKEIRTVQTSLQTTLETTQEILATSQDKLKMELVELKQARLAENEQALPALTSKIKTLETAVQKGSAPLEKLDEISVTVANTKDMDALTKAASELKMLLDETTNEVEKTSEDIASNSELIQVQVVEQRIDNLNQVQQEKNILDIAKISELQQEIQQEVADLADADVITPERKQELVEKVASSIANEGLATVSPQTQSSEESKSESVSNSKSASVTDNISSQTSNPESKTGNDQETRQRNIENIKDSSPKKTGDYHWADLNKNDWISPDEVLHFIDLLFEGEAERSVEDIQNLIDYYFDQE